MELEVAIRSFDGESGDKVMHIECTTMHRPKPGSMDECAHGGAFPQQAMSLGCRQGAWSTKAAPTEQSLAGALGDHRQKLNTVWKRSTQQMHVEKEK